MPTTININGVSRTVDVDGDTPLLWVLRDVFGMSGTKFGRGMAIAPEVSTGAGFNPSVGEHYEHRRTCA